MKRIYISVISLFLFNSIFVPAAFSQASEIRPIYFPTEREATFTDCFGDPRSGHSHEGIDMMGEQMMKLYSAVDGLVIDVVDPETYWGYALTLNDSEGYTYHYLHVNNDTPGTDDGQGGTKNAYAPGITKGMRVVKGQHIGWMGDSGNAETVGPHLHFEIRRPDKTAIDPYSSLVAALDSDIITVINPNIDYSIEAAKLSSQHINTDKGLSTSTSAACISGSLIKLSGMEAVYFCGADGKRYTFPNERIYFTWYENFENVTEVSPETMASIPLSGNITYRPGVKMVKVQTDPKVYAVARGGELRWIRSAELAAQLYGADWKKKVDDLPDAFFFDYKVGRDIN